MKPLLPKEIIEEIRKQKWAIGLEITDESLSKTIEGFKNSFHKALTILSSIYVKIINPRRPIQQGWAFSF
jgi:hypothetical protein